MERQFGEQKQSDLQYDSARNLMLCRITYVRPRISYSRGILDIKSSMSDARPLFNNPDLHVLDLFYAVQSEDLGVGSQNLTVWQSDMNELALIDSIGAWMTTTADQSCNMKKNVTCHGSDRISNTTSKSTCDELCYFFGWSEL